MQLRGENNTLKSKDAPLTGNILLKDIPDSVIFFRKNIHHSRRHADAQPVTRRHQLGHQAHGSRTIAE